MRPRVSEAHGVKDQSGGRDGVDASPCEPSAARFARSTALQTPSRLDLVPKRPQARHQHRVFRVRVATSLAFGERSARAAAHRGLGSVGR